MAIEDHRILYAQESSELMYSGRLTSLARTNRAGSVEAVQSRMETLDM